MSYQALRERDRIVWRVQPREPKAETPLARAAGISRVTAALLLHRGITTAQAAKAYLSPSIDDLCDPSSLPDIDRAVALVNDAIDRRATVLVHGDYDVDGLTATALLVRFLSKLGVNVQYFIPHRVHDHYGLSAEAIEKAAVEGISLVIAVDCGVRDLEACARARELGLKLIVLDHHEPGHTLPCADALVDPKLEASVYPNRELAAAGLALQLARATAASRGIAQQYVERAFLDLAAVGTIADVVPLVAENRALASLGLARLARTKKLGLKTLMNLCQVNGSPRAEHVAFRIGPRINAAGRLADAHPSLSLLLTDDQDEANRTALYLDGINRQRQQEQNAICDDARAMVEREVDLAETACIVLASESWHIGVVGIAASQIVGQYGRPVILLAAEGDTCRGSGRSIPGFNLAAALDECQDFLVRYGGHAMAVGAAVRADQLRDFRRALNEVGRKQLDPSTLQPCLDIDMAVSLTEVTWDLVSELGAMEPYGNGNPEPTFAAFGARVADWTVVGRDNQHLKMWVTDEECTYECIGFGMAREQSWLGRADRVDLCFIPQFNDFDGSRIVQLRLHAIRPARQRQQARMPAPRNGLEEDGSAQC